MTQEALRMALDALEVSTDWDVTATGKQLKSMQAITALRKVLAQEQDGQCKRCTDGCPACDATKLQKEAHDLL